MARPSKKSPEMEQFLKHTFGFNRQTHIVLNKCVPPPIGCGSDATTFTDEASAREYRISGLCQACQNKIFGA